MNISVIGAKGLAKELGKKGTSSDITLYNTSFQGKIFTFIEPEKYPEKVQTLFQSMNMSQFLILYITNELPKNILGECIIAADMLRMNGIIVLDGIDKEEIKPFLNETVLKGYPIINNNIGDIMTFLSSVEIKKIDGKPKVVIDHSFAVKSVGTVALGTVVSGEIKKYDKLTLFPAKKEVIIKSIQMNDKDFDKAECFDRVGISVKGAEVSDLTRGSVISEDMECVKEVRVSLIKNKFFQEEIPKNVMSVIGLQYVNAKVEGDKITFSSEVAFDNDKIVLLVPDKKIRVLGVAERLK